MNQGQPLGSGPPFALAILAVAMLLPLHAQAAPVGGVVTQGGATISSQGTRTTITQNTGNAVINWQGFGIAAGEAVHFQQPSSSSVVLNRVVGPDPSAIYGSLSANGKVFLVNPGGVLFGAGESVNVGGLVASSLNISDGDFMAGHYTFTGGGRGAVVNQGAITADGGYVALLGTDVSNQGVISARLGSVAMAAGESIRLDVLGDNLLHVTIDRAAVDALVRNGGLLQGDGGQVVLTTQAAGSLLAGAVNNTGIIQAQTISSRNGTIRLLGNMSAGSVDVAGTLDASAPKGGDGGFIETSASRVRVHDGATISTAAPLGHTGTWLIDPQDFTIGSGPTDNISGATLSALLVTNSVTIATEPGPDVTVAGTPPVTHLNTAVPGNGDIHVNDAVSWTGAPSTTTLTLNAARDVNVNAAITAVNGNVAVCCGRDVNVHAAITTTNGSVLLSAGRNATLSTAAAVTTTDGNMMICAANDVSIASALTLTRGSTIPAQSLGLPAGLVLNAGTGGTGPGAGGGTVVFAPAAPPAAVTGPNAQVTVNYNPTSYATPTIYLPHFTLTNGATLTQHMLVFPISPDRAADGSTGTTLAGLKGSPPGVTLVAAPGSSANFDTALAGTGKPITFTGYTLDGLDAGLYALPVACCGPAVGRTTGTLLTPAVPTVPLVLPVPPGVVTPPDVAYAGVIPQFAPFLVAPFLLHPDAPLWAEQPVAQAPMEIVRAPVPAARTVAPEVAAPPVEQAAPPAAPRRAPPRPAKPYRN